MPSPKNYVLALLAVTTLGGAALAWWQYSDLLELRAAAMKKDERAALQKRVWDLEKSNRELQDRLAAQRGPGDGDNALAGGPADRNGERPRGGRGDPRGRGGDVMLQQATALRDLMAKPEVQALLNQQQKAAIDARYAALFKNLNLTPEQAENLKAILADRRNTMQDAFAVARDQGIDPRSDPQAFQKIRATADNEINNSIRALIGDAGLAQLQTYEQTLPQRNLVNDLQQRLSYTSSPLSSQQAEQLVQILATTAPTKPANADVNFGPGGPGGPPPDGRGPGGRGPGGPDRGPDLGGMVLGMLGGGGGGPGGGIGPILDPRANASAPVTPAAIAQAQTVLAPAQVAALQQIQQQQQAQQQLQQLVRDTVVATTAANPRDPATKGANTAPAANSGTPPRKRGG